MEKVMIEWFIKPNYSIGKEKPIYDMGGEYNGYVVIHRSHPYFGLDYDDVPIDAHGGITFTLSAKELKNWPELKDAFKTEDYWVFGFDTLHSGDSKAKWPKEAIEKETAEFAGRFYLPHIKKIRDDNRNECRTGLQEGDGGEGKDSSSQ